MPSRRLAIRSLSISHMSMSRGPGVDFSIFLTLYLWTKGFIPELGTYPGREVPKPLAVEIVKGDTDTDASRDPQICRWGW